MSDCLGQINVLMPGNSSERSKVLAGTMTLGSR